MMRVTGIEAVFARIEAVVASASNVDSKRKALLEKLKEATPVDTGHARDGWRIEGQSIVNDVPYIKELNGGSSKQAPAYFIEKELLEDQQVKPNGTMVVYR